MFWLPPIAMSTPVIGLTTFRQVDPYGHAQLAIKEAYVRALSAAGAAPLLIPLGVPEAALDRILAGLDGVLFTGGGDVHPECYGSQLHPLVDEVDLDRDRVEIHLVKQVSESGMPFLGICRGLQVINIALGGTLYEDILDQRPGSLRHQYYPDWPRDYLAHDVLIETDSRLHMIVGHEKLPVNSLHHQGVRQLAPLARPTAFAPDGIIEAIELPTHPYGMAVQWHPEWLPTHSSMQAIFKDFVAAATEWSKRQRGDIQRNAPAHV